MNVYNVTRAGVYVRQIVANSTAEARFWVRHYLGGCSVRFSHRLS